jgi:hypothetical protein
MLLLLDEGTTREQLEAIQPDFDGMKEATAGVSGLAGVIVTVRAGELCSLRSPPRHG